MIALGSKSTYLLLTSLVLCLLIGPSRQADEDATIKIFAQVKENKSLGFIVTDLSVGRTLSNMCEVMKQTLTIDNSTGTGKNVDVLGVESEGEVFIKNEVDREALCGKSEKCSLSLLIGDGDDFYRVQVQVEDVNDNHPYFPACNSTSAACQLIVNVPESLELDTVVHVEHLRAYDYDIGRNARIYYEMKDQYFDLEKYPDGRLDLKLKKPLDFEKDSTHTFIFQALDGGLLRQLTSPIISILVKISNVNDHAPVFRKNPYKVNVNEGKDKGYVLQEVNAIDNDAKPYNELTYRLSKDNNDVVRALVEVKPDGKVVLKKPVDSKEHNNLVINIEVLDHLPENAETRYGETKLIVEVEDMNNNDPKINFIFSAKQHVIEEESTGAVYIPEDIKPDAYFAVVEATDEDIGENAMISLLIDPSTPADNIFQLQKISSDVGNYQAKLMINTALDREKRKSYCVNVQACDQGSKKRCAVKRLNIELLDVNDNPPVFAPVDVRVKVTENASVGEVVATVHATDLDSSNPPVYMRLREGNQKVHSTNGDVTYTIVNGRGDFKVDTVSGEVTVDRKLDREKNEEYHLTIVARDNGKERPLESSMTLHITVLDINDNIPDIYDPEHDQNVYASTIKDQIIITIKATDEDRDSNGQLSFFLVDKLMSEENLQLFKLDEKSGELRLNFNLGAEKLKESMGLHSLFIEVRDHGKTAHKSSTRNFMVTVIDSVIPEPKPDNSIPSTAGANVTSIIVGVIIGILLLFTCGLGLLWYRRCYMGRNKACPINEKMDKHEHRELLHLDSYSNKDKNTNDSSSRASGEWKEANNIDNSRYDEMREVNVVNDELPMRKPSYSSNMTTFDPRSSNVSSMNTKITNLSSLTKQQECDSGRGDSSPDAVSHVEVAPFEQNHLSATTSKDQVVMEPVKQPKLVRHHRNDQEELGPYCTNTCLSHGHHDGCWINLTPMQPPYHPAQHQGHHHENMMNSSPSSLYVDLYPPQIPQQYMDNSPAPSNGSRHFYPPYPTSTLTSIYSSVLAPEQQQRHYAPQQQREIYGVAVPARPSSALPHKQNRIIHATPSSSSSVSANHQQQQRRYHNQRFEQHIGSYSPGMEPGRPAAHVHNKFRRSASTDAILRGASDLPSAAMSSPTSPVATDNHNNHNHNGDGSEKKMTMRETRVIVANIERLLTD